MLIECSVYVHDNAKGERISAHGDVRRRLLRDQRISHRLELYLVDLALSVPGSLTPGLQSSWADFNINVVWSTVTTHPHWIENTIVSEYGGRTLTVRFNTLDGELLVDGRPLSRLPADYVTSDIYIRIFGKVSFISPLTYGTKKNSPSHWHPDTSRIKQCHNHKLISSVACPACSYFRIAIYDIHDR